MQVLVSTTETQGEEPGDFNFVPDGEIVAMYGFVCHDWRGSCGCGRAFSGVVSHKATTSAKVAEVDLTREELLAIIETCLGDAGWLQMMETPEEKSELVNGVLDDMLRVADAFPVGSVLSRHVLGSDNDLEPPVEDYILRNSSLAHG